MTDTTAPDPFDSIIASVTPTGGNPGGNQPVDDFDQLLLGVPKRAVRHTARDVAPVVPMSNDANDQRPSSRDVSNKWQPANTGEYLAQRGRQAASGATEAIAALPEAMEIADRGRQLTVKRSSEEVLPQLSKERDELNAIIAQNQEKAKAGDWEATARIKAAESRLYQVDGQIQMAGRMKDDAKSALALPIDGSLGFQAGKGIRNSVAGTIGQPDPRDDSFGGQLAYGFGNMIGMLGTTVAAGAVTGGTGAVIVGAGQGAAMNSSQIYKEAIAAGASEETAIAASKWAGVAGMSEIVPIMGALKFVPASIRGKLTNKLLEKAGEIVLDSAGEGLQEYGQQVVNNLIAAGLVPNTTAYDPKRKWDEGALQSAIIGSIIGGTMGATGAAVHRGEVSPDQEAALTSTVAPEPAATAQADASAGAATSALPTTPVGVAPDQAAALDAGKPKATSTKQDILTDILGAPPAKAPATPAAEAPVTPEGNAAPAPAAEAPAAAPVSGPETAGDTLPTVSETPDTIAEQNKALLDPKNPRKAVFIPYSNTEADAPSGKGIKMLPVDEGVIYYDSKVIGEKSINLLYKNGQLGKVLGLGNFNKADVAKSAAQGNPEVAVTERTPAGVEVKAAAGTTATAPDQLASLEADKTPGNTVQVESPAQVLADRQSPAAEALAGLEQAKPTSSATPPSGVTEVSSEGLTLIHGGRSGLSLDSVEIVRNPADQKQGKKGRSYGGFYATSETDADYAQSYADKVEGGAAYDVRIKPGTKVLQKEGDITRLSETQIAAWKQDGIGVVVGKDPRGKTEYAVIDKDAIEKLSPRKSANEALTEQVEKPTEQVETSSSAAEAPAASSPAAQAVAELSTAEKAAKVREQAIRALEPQLTEMGLTVGQVIAMPQAKQRVTIEQAKKVKPEAKKDTSAKPFEKYGDVLKHGPDGWTVNKIAWTFESAKGHDGPRYLRIRTLDRSKLFQSSPDSGKDSYVTDIWETVDPDAVEHRGGNKVGINGVEANTPPDLAPIFREWLEHKIEWEEAIARIKNTDFGAAEKAEVAPKAEVAKEVAKTRAAPAPKAEKAKEVAKARTESKASPPVTAQGNRTEVSVDPTTGKRTIRIIPSAEEQKAINEGNDRFNAARAASAGSELDTTELDEQRQKANRGELGEGELGARRTGQGKDAGREAKAVEAAKKAKELLDATPYEGAEEIRTLQDASKVYDRLVAILNDAKARGVEIPGRIRASHTNAQAWLASVKTMASKLAKIGNIKGAAAQAEAKMEVAAFLSNELLFRNTGDASGLREDRLEAGAAASKTSAPENNEGDADIGDTVADEGTMTGEEALVAKQEEAEKDTGNEAAVSTNFVEQAKPKTVIEPGSEPEIAGVTFDDKGKPITKKAAAVVAEVKKKRVFTKPGAKVTSEGKPERARMEQAPTTERTQASVSTAPDAVEDARALIDTLGTHYYDDAVVTDDVKDAIMDKLGTKAPEANFATETTTVKGELARVENDDIREYASLTGYFTLAQREAQYIATSRVYKMLAKLAGSVKVHYLADEDVDRFDPYARAYYNPDGDYVVMRESLLADPSRFFHVLTHEVAHAAFWHALRADPIVGRQVEALRKIAAKWAAKNGLDPDMNGLKNIDEFVSDAFADPAFQEFLSGIKLGLGDYMRLGTTVTQRGKVKTALDWMKTKVADVFGFSASGPTAFDAAMQFGEKLMDASVSARKTYYKRNPTLAAPRSRMEIKPGAKEASVETKLKKLGLNDRQAKSYAKTIKDLYNNQVTDEQLSTIATRVKEATKAAKETVKAAKEAAGQVETAVRKQATDFVEEMEKTIKPTEKPGLAWNRALRLMKLTQIARMSDRWFGSENNPVRKISDLLNHNRVLKRRYMKELGDKVSGFEEALAAHTPEQVKEFFSLAHDSTLANVHPDRPLDAQPHLGKDALRGMWSKAQHADLAKRYAALPQDLKDLYHHTSATLAEAQNKMAHGVMRNILNAAGFEDEAMIKRFFEDQATEADYAAVGESLADHLKKATELKKIQGPYFNLVRRGDHVVRGFYKITPPGNAKVIAPENKGDLPNTFEFKSRKEAIAYAQSDELKGFKTDIKSAWIDGKTGKTYFEDEKGQVKVSPKDTDAKNVFRVTVQNQHVEFVQGKRAAKKLHRELTKQGLQMKDVVAKKYQRAAANADMLSDQYRALMETLSKRDATSNLTPLQKAELKGVLNEFSLRQLGATRIQSSKLPRRHVLGASQDLVRNTYDYIEEVSGYLAKLDTQPGIDTAMKELDAAAKVLEDKNQGFGAGAGEIRNEINKRVLDVDYNEADGTLEGAIRRIKTVTFLMRLGSTGFSVINAAQPLALTLPHLSGDFNPGAAAHQLIKAYHDISAVKVLANGVTDTAKGLAGVRSDGDTHLNDVMGRLKEPREREMMQKMTDLNLMGEDSDIGIERLAEKSEGAIKLFDIPVEYLENIMRALPQAVETNNRAVTALAAYRLMYAKTKNHEKAIQYAGDAVDETQGNNSAINSPPVFNSMAGRVLLQFKKYPQNVIVLLAKNVRRSVMGGAPGERRKGLLTMAYLLAATQVSAGTMGLPWEPAKLALMAARALGLTDLEWDDFEQKIEEFYAWLTGSDKAAEALTYGVTRALPGGMDFDLNSRMGMDTLVSFGDPRSNKESDVKSWLFDTVLGPNVGTLMDIGGGLNQIAHGDVMAGMEKAFPLKVGSDIIKAFDPKQKRDTPQKKILTILGLKPGDVARQQKQTSRDISAKNKSKEQHNALISDYISATSGSQIAKMTSKIRAYNDTLPKNSMSRISLKWVEGKRREEYAKSH